MSGTEKSEQEFVANYGLPVAWKRAIILFPIIAFSLFAVAMFLESTQDYAFALVEDNNVVDILTFLPAFAGGVLGIIVAMRARRLGKEKLVWLFYLLFALGLIFIGGEETSWGQNLYHYRTPEVFDRWNEQGEVTIHNLDGLNDRNHFLRLAFGAGGLIGLLAWKSARFRDLAPPRVLQIWLWLIALKSALDIYTTPYAARLMNAYIVAQLSEVIEMLIAIAGLLYVWLNGRRLQRQTRSD
ncbi:MAG: hypothetical protein DLM52_02225 [Chthoniobacterales bacterium]|nr:MAG: hypothetical protein DLM52_02225 [Chthoniobacterales bacterium]